MEGAQMRTVDARRAVVVAIAVAALFVGALASSAGEAVAYQTTGNVTEQGTANLVSGARVDLFGMNGFDAYPVGRRTTDGFGWYGFMSIPNDTGWQWIRVWKPGYLTTKTGTFVSGASVFKNVSLPIDPHPVERVAGSDRYSTATKIAWSRYDGWDGVSGVVTIVIASGEDYAAADPLAAAGLCGVYDAPLFLVGKNHVPQSVKEALLDMNIGDGSTNARFVVVGGTATVPQARIDEMADVWGGGYYTTDRIISGGDRYDLAAAIAERMEQVDGTPSRALIANGADPAKFFDPLALSTISARRAYPILLVEEDSVPWATKAALDDLGNPNIVIGGGPATVSEGVMTELGAKSSVTERFWGADRYETAIEIADQARARGWLSNYIIGVAAKLPDALTGGSMIGKDGGCLVITDGNSLTPSTETWLENQKSGNDKCWVFGGDKSITPQVRTQIEDALK
jgi:putative cell wall-binding protein